MRFQLIATLALNSLLVPPLLGQDVQASKLQELQVKTEKDPQNIDLWLQLGQVCSAKVRKIKLAGCSWRTDRVCLEMERRGSSRPVGGIRSVEKLARGARRGCSDLVEDQRRSPLPRPRKKTNPRSLLERRHRSPEFPHGPARVCARDRSAGARGWGAGAQTAGTQSKVLAGKAELRALRAQINPHFLFNALRIVRLSRVQPVVGRLVADLGRRPDAA